MSDIVLREESFGRLVSIGLQRMSATFVIGTDGRVAYRSVTADYRWRIGPAEVVAALDEVSSNHEAVASPAGSGDPSTQRG